MAARTRTDSHDTRTGFPIVSIRDPILDDLLLLGLLEQPFSNGATSAVLIQKVPLTPIPRATGVSLSHHDLRTSQPC